MKTFFCATIAFCFLVLTSFKPSAQEFQGKAYYFSKTQMDLGSWGKGKSEAEIKQVQARLKNRLEKVYILDFNKEASVFNEEKQIDAMAGATDTWGSNFTRGEQYKNVKENKLVQSQEFYGKKFLVKDDLYVIDWKTGKESKKIGQYMCFKATASIPESELTWFDFSWGELRNRPAPDSADAATTEEGAVAPEVPMVEVEAWYTLQIPVSHGPAEFYGLPGLILEVTSGGTTMLCSKVVMNPEDKIAIVAPAKGKEISKAKYKETIVGKMVEMRNNRGRRRN